MNLSELQQTTDKYFPRQLEDLLATMEYEIDQLNAEIEAGFILSGTHESNEAQLRIEEIGKMIELIIYY